MRSTDWDGDAALALMERRWFATLAAVRTLQAECEVLREVMEQAQAAWHRARSELTQVESLRDALGETLSRLDDCRAAPARESHAMDSAA